MILLVISDLVTLVMQEDELRRADPVEFFEGQCVFFQGEFDQLWISLDDFMFSWRAIARFASYFIFFSHG